jgi:formylglycine-generating enzyme required for sulfatase activity
MSTNNKHKVSEKELDNLIGQAFLNLDFNNPKNQELMETISNQVLPTSPANASIINKAFFTKLIGILAIIGTTAFIYFHYFSNTNKQEIKKNIVPTISSSTSKQVIEDSKQELGVNNSSTIIETKQENQVSISETTQHQEPTINESPKHQIPSTSYIDENKKVKNEDTNYVFPKLTEKEIKETKKQKDRMTNWLNKKSKEKFVLISTITDKQVFGVKTDSLKSFYIQNAEVTNLEYRTFLFDILLNGEKDAFLKAKPHQYLWLTATGHTKRKVMKDDYFSDKLYNDYPVVNITPEGAELYCKWLSKLYHSNDDNIIANLPTEKEWMKAAKGKNANASYPWPGDSIQNKNGCFLANFCIEKQNEKLRTNIKCSPKNKNAYSSAEYMLGDSMMPCKIYSYNPNDFGAFCMTGNVAEMVYENKTKSIITKGGSWNSDFDQCKLYNREELNGTVKANPMTGFRPVFRLQPNFYLGAMERDDAKTGLTTLTAEEIKIITKQKKKMIEDVVKKNNDKYALIPMGSFLYKKDTFSVQAFYMQTTEVSNLEYRTFLMDLLIQNRASEYLIAKPNQEMWITKFPWSFNEPMTNLYFSHPAYDDYPVVNISRKAAEMYCIWLTVEVNKILKENNKPLINDLRLPVDIEWACAARQYDLQTLYANGLNSLKDNKEKYTVNYMCAKKVDCRYDSTLKLLIPKSKTHSYIEDGGFHTLQVKSYKPNKFGLYCMAGNVAEMVNTFDKATMKYIKTGTKGGSWFSCDYFLEIDADDEYPGEEGSSPLIGFRPVMTALKTK